MNNRRRYLLRTAAFAIPISKTSPYGMGYPTIYSAWTLFLLSLVSVYAAIKLERAWIKIAAYEILVLAIFGLLFKLFLSYTGESLFKLIGPYDSDIVPFILNFAIVIAAIVLLIIQAAALRSRKEQAPFALRAMRIIALLPGCYLEVVMPTTLPAYAYWNVVLAISLPRVWAVVWTSVIAGFVLLEHFQLILLSIDSVQASAWIISKGYFLVAALIVVESIIYFIEKHNHISEEPSSPVQPEEIETVEILTKTISPWLLYFTPGIFVAILSVICDVNIILVDAFALNRLLVRAFIMPILALILFYIVTRAAAASTKPMQMALKGVAVWWLIYMAWSIWDIY